MTLSSPLPKLVLTNDSESPPLSFENLGPEIQVWPDLEGNVFSYCFNRQDLYWICLPGLASFCFDSQAEEVKAIPHPPAPPELVQETYYRSVLPIVLQRVGKGEVLHASGVLMPHGVIAVCGRSGTGKSTTAYGLRQRGHLLWADDAVAFEASSVEVMTLQLPFDIQLRPASLAYFRRGEVAQFTHTSSTTRAMKETEPLTALFLLKRDASSPGIETHRLSSAQAFAPLLSHAYCFSLHDIERKRRMMERYLDLTARIPIFEIRFSPGLEKLPAILDQIEQHSSRPFNGTL
jgi:hypothetical protein